MAQPGTVQQGTAASCSTARLSTAQPNTAQHNLSWPSPGQASPAQLTREGQYGPPRPDVPAAPLRSHTTQVCWGSASPLPHPCPSESSLPGAHTGDRGVLLCPSPGTPTLPSAGPHAPPRCHPHTLLDTNPCPLLPRHAMGSVSTPSTAQVSLPSHGPPRTTPRFPATPSRGVRKTAPAPQRDSARRSPVPRVPVPGTALRPPRPDAGPQLDVLPPTPETGGSQGVPAVQRPAAHPRPVPVGLRDAREIAGTAPRRLWHRRAQGQGGGRTKRAEGSRENEGIPLGASGGTRERRGARSGADHPTCCALLRRAAAAARRDEPGRVGRGGQTGRGQPPPTAPPRGGSAPCTRGGR